MAHNDSSTRESRMMIIWIMFIICDKVVPSIYYYIWISSLTWIRAVMVGMRTLFSFLLNFNIMDIVSVLKKANLSFVTYFTWIKYLLYLDIF